MGLTGTTEKIFEEKRELYDVYVDNQNVKTHHDHLQPLLKIDHIMYTIVLLLSFFFLALPFFTHVKPCPSKPYLAPR